MAEKKVHWRTFEETIIFPPRRIIIICLRSIQIFEILYRDKYWQGHCGFTLYIVRRERNGRRLRSMVRDHSVGEKVCFSVFCDSREGVRERRSGIEDEGFEYRFPSLTRAWVKPLDCPRLEIRRSQCFRKL